VNDMEVLQYRKVAQALVHSERRDEQALGVYLSGRQDKTSGAGRGASNRERAKQGHIYRVDPAILGQFRIDVTDPDWNQTFYPKANR